MDINREVGCTFWIGVIYTEEAGIYMEMTGIWTEMPCDYFWIKRQSRQSRLADPAADERKRQSL